MSQDSDAVSTGPGFFFVLIQPKLSLSLDDFHAWYNSEHGPLRTKLDFVSNGYRYKSRGIEPPFWLACYDLTRVSGLWEKQYTTLRENRSDRENHIFNDGLDFIDRRIYSNLSVRGTNDAPAPVLLTVRFVVKDKDVQEIDDWYEQEHTELLMKIPGWIRSRRFRLAWSEDQKKGTTELLAVHEFAAENGLDGLEHKYAQSTPWRGKILDMVLLRDKKLFDFYHDFNHQLDQRQVTAIKSRRGTLNGPSSWKFDGSRDAQAPVIVFSDSLLTNYHIWDSTVEALNQAYPHYRYLRYNTRGYLSNAGETVTADLLADDLADLLDELDIEKCFAVVGVSLGGVTALNFATRYPHRLSKLIACDCNISSTSFNTEAWMKRVSVAEEADGWERLAEQTVHRWFTPDSRMDGKPELQLVKDMILSASKQGFVDCVAALCDFDLSQSVRSMTIPGLFVVGEGDGQLPAAMRSYVKTIPNAVFAEIPQAGHLPMLENSSAFVEAVSGFLGNG